MLYGDNEDLDQPVYLQSDMGLHFLSTKWMDTAVYTDPGDLAFNTPFNII